MHINTPMTSNQPKKNCKTFFSRLHIPILLCLYTQFANANDLEITLQTVRTWVNNGMTVSEENNTTSENISGICVVLRKNGDLLGYGEAFGENVPLLANAAQIAFSKAKKHPIIRGNPPARSRCDR